MATTLTVYQYTPPFENHGMLSVDTVTDRTAADVAAGKAGDLTNPKAFFDFRVMRRIEDNLASLYSNIQKYEYGAVSGVMCSYLTDLLCELTYSSLDPTWWAYEESWFSDWYVEDNFTIKEFLNLYRRLAYLVDHYIINGTTAVPSTIDGFSYIDLNAVEQIIQEAQDTFEAKRREAVVLSDTGLVRCGGSAGGFIW